MAFPGDCLSGNPVLSHISPTSGPIGTTVHVYGCNFQVNQGSGKVKIGSVVQTIVAWGSSDITIRIAAGTVDGQLKVTSSTGAISDSRAFNVT
jgi:hypothetical protein